MGCTWASTTEIRINVAFHGREKDNMMGGIRRMTMTKRNEKQDGYL
jgi:hypothetical protein